MAVLGLEVKKGKSSRSSTVSVSKKVRKAVLPQQAPIIPPNVSSVSTRLGPYESSRRLALAVWAKSSRARYAPDRTVAVKILPSHLSVILRCGTRFEQERKLSQLNHPPHFARSMMSAIKMALNS